MFINHEWREYISPLDSVQIQSAKVEIKETEYKTMNTEGYISEKGRIKDGATVKLATTSLKPTHQRKRYEKLQISVLFKTVNASACCTAFQYVGVCRLQSMQQSSMLKCR